MACDIFMHGGIRTQVVLYYAFLKMLQLWNCLHSTSHFRDHVVIVYPRYDAKSRSGCHLHVKTRSMSSPESMIIATWPHAPRPLAFTSANHTCTHNRAPDTWHAFRTNHAHDVHEIHACNSYKTPSSYSAYPPPSTSPPLLACLHPDYPATTCRSHNAASQSRTSDTRVQGWSCHAGSDWLRVSTGCGVLGRVCAWSGCGRRYLCGGRGLVGS